MLKKIKKNYETLLCINTNSKHIPKLEKVNQVCQNCVNQTGPNLIILAKNCRSLNLWCPNYFETQGRSI